MANGTDGVRMAKAKNTKPRDHLFRWRVSLIKATPAKFVGYVRAPDEASAIEMAVEDYGISDRLRDRLVAIRED
jgi:hypothetical protein